MTAEILPVPDAAAGLEPAPRLVAKKLSLRVSGSRIGSVARPAESAPAAAAAGPRPRMFGLRVHGSPLAPRPATTSPGAPEGPEDGPAAEGYAWDDGGRP